MERRVGTTRKSLRVPNELLKGLAQLRLEHPERWASEHAMLLDLLAMGYAGMRYPSKRRKKDGAGEEAR